MEDESGALQGQLPGQQDRQLQEVIDAARVDRPAAEYAASDPDKSCPGCSTLACWLQKLPDIYLDRHRIASKILARLSPLTTVYHCDSSEGATTVKIIVHTCDIFDIAATQNDFFASPPDPVPRH